MTRPSVVAFGLILGGVIFNAGCGSTGHPASIDSPPAVIAPKAVLLRTPDSLGNTAFEMSVALSPDGRTVAAGRMESSGTVVSLYDLPGGRERATIKGPFVESCAVAFSPDGRTLAVGLQRAVKLYDPETGHERAELTAEDAYDCLCLAYSPDGLRLAAATGMGYVMVWDISTGRSLGSFKAHTRSLHGVAFSPDGQKVASASDGPIVCHTIGGGLFGFGPREIACGPEYGIVRLFDADTGQETASLKHKWTVHSASLSPDGKSLASGGGGATKLWDLATGDISTIIEVGDELDVYCVSFSSDGRTLAVGVGSEDFHGSQGEVKLWDMSRGRVRAVLQGDMGKVRSLSFSPDGKALVTGSGEVVVLWDLAMDSSR